jgi:hypothetical protein
MNRASEKVVTTAASATLAVFAVLTAVIVFGSEPDLSARFPSTFYVFAANKMPAGVPFRPVLQGYFLVAELAKDNPEALRDEDNGWTSYHEFLQKTIIDILAFRYTGNWDVDVVRYRTSRGAMLTSYPGASTQSVKLSTSDLEKVFEGTGLEKSIG